MAHLISAPTRIGAAGTPSKTICEFVGRVNTRTKEMSLAVMESPSGWAGPGQIAEFDEYTVVIDGELFVETRDGSLPIRAGQAVHAAAGEWVRYSTPATNGARYVSVCLPAFSPETVHRQSVS